MTKPFDSSQSLSQSPWVFVGDDWLVKEAVACCRRHGVRGPFVVLNDAPFLLSPDDGPMTPVPSAVLWPGVGGQEEITSWFKDNNTMVITDPVDRCLWKTRRLVFKDGRVMTYDRLIVVQAQTPSTWTSKEAALEGTISWFKGIEALRRLKGRLASSETFVIDGETTASLQLALSLTEVWRKEVYWLMSGDEPFSEWAPVLVRRHLHQRLTGVKGLRLLHHQRIHHILGDQQVKAVRSTANKIIAADAVVSFRAKPTEASWIGSVRRQREQIGLDDDRRTEVVFIDVDIDPDAPFDWLRQTACQRLEKELMIVLGTDEKNDASWNRQASWWCDRILWNEGSWFFAGLGDYWRTTEGVTLIRQAAEGLSIAVWHGDQWSGWAGTDETMLGLFEMYARRRGIGRDAMISWMRAWGHRIEILHHMSATSLPGWRLLPAGVG